MEHPHATNHTSLNIILLFFTGIFKILEESSAEEIYTWVFRFFSLLSLFLIIIINWKKAWITIFPKKDLK